MNTEVCVVDVSLIVPTLNEAENLPALVHRVDTALAGRRWEIIIVDDASTDNTTGVCAALGAVYPLRCLERTTPTGGLSGAVLHGMAAAQGEYLVVMDADLQHPPERIVDLLAALKSGPCDLALGSRYIIGGKVAGRWGWLRHLNSAIATMLARPLTGKLHDPMSGFFALRRQTYLQATGLNPMGYKIALELICKCPIGRITEVPINFGLRQAGQSKLCIRQQWMYLRHLAGLYANRWRRPTTAHSAMAWQINPPPSTRRKAAWPDTRNRSANFTQAG